MIYWMKTDIYNDKDKMTIDDTFTKLYLYFLGERHKANNNYLRELVNKITEWGGRVFVEFKRFQKDKEYHELKILNRPHKKIVFTVILPNEPRTCKAWRLQENTGSEIAFNGPSKTDKGWEISTSNSGWIFGEIYRIEWEK